MAERCPGNCIVCGKCGKFNILDGFSSEKRTIEPREGFGVALDLGTTSVVLALLELSSGRVLARHSFLNPQRVYGPDALSRVGAAVGGHLHDLRDLITQCVCEGLCELLHARGVSDIEEIVVAGNTVMTHLLLGLPCDSLGAFPFQPSYPLSESYTCADVFPAAGFDCPVTILPWLAAFVGGDITAGLLHVLNECRERFLLIDLGTNGEMALYNQGALTVASTAAGPAFEGSRRSGGASEALSGLAALCRDGWIEESGLLAPGAPHTFTQQEIRDLQLAKSAVRSGLEILLESSGLNDDGLDTVFLAGGIGRAIDINDAVTIGLLPERLQNRVRAIGNASLGGAARRLLAPKQAAIDLERLLIGVREINLGSHPSFSGYFMAFMGF